MFCGIHRRMEQIVKQSHNQLNILQIWVNAWIHNSMYTHLLVHEANKGGQVTSDRRRPGEKLPPQTVGGKRQK